MKVCLLLGQKKDRQRCSANLYQYERKSPAPVSGIFILGFGCSCLQEMQSASSWLPPADVPASVVVCCDRSVDLDHEFVDLAAVQAVDLAWFIIVLYPVVAGCVFGFVLAVREFRWFLRSTWFMPPTVILNAGDQGRGRRFRSGCSVP